MILWQANLGRGVSVAEFTRNLQLVLDAGGPRAVYCFQEIDEADLPEEMDILKRLVAKTHHVVGEQTAVPILVPFYLRLFSARIEPACKGLAKFTPNRVINEAVIQLGPNLAPGILCGHMPIKRAETTSRRADVRLALRRRARAHEAGVWVMDTNSRKGWPTIVRGEASVTEAGIDKAKAWGPADRRVIVTDQRTVSLSIDGHDAHGARVRWEKV